MSILVIGSGVAGLSAAITAVQRGAEVTLLTKAALEDSNSMMAQGGYAAVLREGERSAGDSVDSHVQDTLSAGSMHGLPAAVRQICAGGADSVDQLVARGVPFDRDASGRYLLTLEAAHSFPRILHVGGDASGRGITSALVATAKSLADQGRLRVIEGAEVSSLVLDSGAGTGVEYLSSTGVRRRLLASAVILATGGAGQLFAHTTNPSVATGDGVLLAARAGAILKDLEFYQFHPTVLTVHGADGSVSSQLVSEAVRGEGAVIRDARGKRFVQDYHPLGELAPRDAVSRALALHARAERENGVAFLDATAIEAERGKGFLAQRFPTLDAMTRAAGFDWTRELLPISPAAHYWMGGVATDLNGATSVPGLYAVGEVACTGVHGANRLASNSLLEGVVFAERAVEHALSGAHDSLDAGVFRGAGSSRPAPREVSIPAASSSEISASSNSLTREDVQAAMERDAGIIRDAAGLNSVRELLTNTPGEDTAADNLRTLGLLLAESALDREESLGAHYRQDSRKGGTWVSSGVVLKEEDRTSTHELAFAERTAS
ncbi:L-aspartate oxidase [Neomicrococcus aestuarii]|uniref:L-aspartate oxidase n=1 Tax=Neomicrococcus aestuarii TaxID=556325 RepID=A0A1L2ZPX0_9MICC|nr:L-aspartate oxidase [Neomicrococcus aestuarii]APF41078.1 L-aspartate oxidase [Neomicrococcus aestuarii]